MKAKKSVRVLVVDDERSIADFIDEVLTAQGYQVSSFSDSEEAYRIAGRQEFQLALIDINMPGINGVQLSKKIMECFPDTEIIIITGVPEENNLDPCLKMGLTHYLFKTFNESQLIYTVYAALHFQRLRNAYLSDSEKIRGCNLIGVSMSTRDVRQEVLSVGKTDLPVLIMGESGTGKEIIARDIHRNSARRSAKPFIPINCAVLGSLAESELFGHVSGAFTGASKTTAGYVGAADKGTLFLDEIGELLPEIQAKLLRFLDDGEYSKVGDTSIRHADVRIVAATNRDLEKMCDEGSFRTDLFYRLSGAIIKTTPLHERKADILPLIWHFLALFGTAKNITYDISADACSRLVEEDWPGNVRQLKQTLYKISQTSDTRKISLADVQRTLGGSGEKQSFKTYKDAKVEVLLDFDKEYLLKTLYLAKGSLKKALELSGMHKKNFYTKIKELGLSVKDFS
ncbi:sigma-54-dependent transcriptional regulator [Desulfopila aestuarii]|uniref:sigma-54-dependent transcriptional regulator n=1 Tax=Desulfopila aestuarii TaxID=231440 RepID=UPI00135630B9|nr:sigma-54 dependent transcriptional regulator [Desulfopila aestuarii]